MKKNFLKTLGVLMMGIFLSNAYILKTGANTMNETDILTPRQQSIAHIAALTAAGDMPKLSKALNKGLDTGLSVNEIKEVLVQMYAYAGFPRSLNGLGAFQNVLKERQAHGITDKTGDAGKELPQGTDKFAYGNQVQIDLTGRPVTGGVMDFAPAIDSFLKEHLFADIFGRGVLSYQDREVATIAALAAMTGVQSQLGSHIQIGMNTGLSDARIAQIIAVVKEDVGVSRAAAATEVLNKIKRGKQK